MIVARGRVYADGQVQGEMEILDAEIGRLFREKSTMRGLTERYGLMPGLVPSTALISQSEICLQPMV